MLDLTTCLFFFADFKAESRCTDAENTVQKLQKEVDKLEGKHDSEPPFSCHFSVKSVPIMKFSLYFFLSVTISRAVFMYIFMYFLPDPVSRYPSMSHRLRVPII